MLTLMTQSTFVFIINEKSPRSGKSRWLQAGGQIGRHVAGTTLISGGGDYHHHVDDGDGGDDDHHLDNGDIGDGHDVYDGIDKDKGRIYLYTNSFLRENLQFWPIVRHKP